jgi:D-glycero-D-manno-heptose 1,7-bisphosphate phosphatase
VHAAAQRSGLRLDDAVMIGDRASDLAAARAAGVRPMLVLTGHGTETARSLANDPVPVFTDLADAVHALLADRHP